MLSVSLIISKKWIGLPKKHDLCHNIRVNRFTASSVIKLFPNATTRVYKAGQVVIYHGDKPNHVMFIKSGIIKFYDTDPDGNEKILHIGGEGSLFPLFYSFEDKESIDAFYATLTRTEVIMVPLTDFQHQLQTSVDYAYKVLRWYAEEMDHIVLRLKSMEKSSAKQRIIQAFYYLCVEHSRKTVRSSWSRINFLLTQQTLADMTGLTRETVNITLKDPEIGKVIRTKKQVYEVNEAKIYKLMR